MEELDNEIRDRENTQAEIAKWSGERRFFTGMLLTTIVTTTFAGIIGAEGVVKGDEANGLPLEGLALVAGGAAAALKRRLNTIDKYILSLQGDAVLEVGPAGPPVASVELPAATEVPPYFAEPEALPTTGVWS